MLSKHVSATVLRRSITSSAVSAAFSAASHRPLTHRTPFALSASRSSVSSSTTSHQFVRTFFWKKANDAAASSDTAATPTSSTAAPTQTLVTRTKEIPDQETNSQDTTSNLNNKSERLGFSGISAALESLLSSWPRIKTYLVWVGVGLGILFVFKVGLNIVDFFATISFLDVGEAAYLAGLVSGVGLLGCISLGTRFLRLRPEPVFKQALQRINKDSTVIQYMGPQIQSSQFRAYSFVPGSIRVTEEQRRLAMEDGARGIQKYYQPKKLQLFFQATGSNGTVGMVSAEVTKTIYGEHKYSLLSIDLAETGERIVLEGDVNYRIYKGVIKLR